MPLVAHHPVLRNPILNKTAQTKQADIVVGLPTDTTSSEQAIRLVQQIVCGLKNHYPHLNTTLINADTGLTADMRQAIQATIDPNIGLVTARYTGVKGEGSAISAILHAALNIQAKAIIILDSKTDDLQPDWIPGLAKLILDKQVDLMKPRYEIPLLDSTLSDLLFYPFIRAVWGIGLQHPTAGDFALSPQAAQTILDADVWETDVCRAGFHIWLSSMAITQKWRLAQSALSAKHYQISRTTEEAITQFKETVGTMLRQLQTHQRVWPKIAICQSVPTLTQYSSRKRHEVTASYEEGVNEEHANIEALILGWIEYRGLWQKILQPEHLVAIEYLASQPVDQFYFPPDLWAKVVYDFTVVYNKGELDPDAVVIALYPLYQGRLASFWPEIAGLTTVGRSGAVSAQGVEFEELKPYLRTRWNTYKPGA